MAISDGNPVNAAYTNTRFMSRTQSTDTVGEIDVLNSTNSTAPTNGSLHTVGGCGIEKDLYVGADAYIGDALTVTGVTTLNDPVVINDSVTITGNITISGTVDGVDVSVLNTNYNNHSASSAGVHGVTGNVVGTTDAQTLTNKSIDADANTITNIDNADIKAAANIVVTKLELLAKGDLITSTGVANVKQSVGTDGFTLKANSAVVNGIEWSANYTAIFNSSQTTLAGGGTITLDSALASEQRIIVEGNGGAVTLSSTPFTNNPVNGATIVLFGNSDTNTVTLTHNNASNGCILNGDITLGQYDVITLIYSSTFGRYVEASRSF